MGRCSELIHSSKRMPRLTSDRSPSPVSSEEKTSAKVNLGRLRRQSRKKRSGKQSRTKRSDKAVGKKYRKVRKNKKSKPSHKMDSLLTSPRPKCGHWSSAAPTQRQSSAHWISCEVFGLP